MAYRVHLFQMVLVQRILLYQFWSLVELRTRMSRMELKENIIQFTVHPTIYEAH